MNLKCLLARRRRMLLAVASLATSVQAWAAPLVVPQIQIDRAIDAVYRCPGGKSLKVTYFNGNNGQSFALMSLQGVPTLMVNTMSADGVRYQAGFMTWWNKGRGGDLYDARVDPNRPVLRGCIAK
ncbi:MliC family protein [Dyella sp. C9]|uniref:MliC family protein n=1 Tax=Dyella sp. C9 TaxID=2202154 RepID=UPI0018E59016|nr:MliC family protein [Dyella sp. C9]